MMLPDYLSDYVILHELAHTRHRDHSARFWGYLDSLTGGDSKQLKKGVEGSADYVNKHQIKSRR